MRSAAALAIALAAGAFAGGAAAAEQLAVRIHRSIPHDPEAFTQGLLWHGGKLYESTGRYGISDLRRVDPRTGAVEQRAAISKMHFGEGLALAGERLVMLTWHAGQALIFDAERLARRGSWGYRGEGWGLCHDGARFVMSDGSDRLAFRDSETFKRLGSVQATLDGAPVAGLNELECVGDAVYANVYGRDFLLRIDPATGRATQRIDASALRADARVAAARDAGVLNGIAYNRETQRFYLTGKLWPVLFETSFEP